jgi:hypothetical protein
MAFPNISDIATTTLESRSGVIRDNVSKNNGLLAQLQRKGRIKLFSGGTKIYEELSFAANSNGGWYSGYDTLPVAAQDVISASEFAIKQYAVPVVVSGLEMLQNAGKEAKIDLLESRIGVAEATMANDISQGVYSDGTGSGGKTITGLDAAVPADPTTGTYGAISRVSYTFWRSQLQDPASTPTSSTIQGVMNTLWAACNRGSDRPDLIVFDSVLWGLYMASLQTIQRFTDASSANLGFPTVKFMDADVILDGGIGGYATASTGYFLNTKYLHWRPHKDRNMVPLDPSKRYATNQDAAVTILGFAGNLTCSGAQFQGRLIGT